MSLEADHAQVALTLLGAVPELTDRVFNGEVPGTPDRPYVLVYASVAWPPGGDVGMSLAGEQVAITTTWVCHCAGETPESAWAVTALVRAALLNVRPVIAGRSCGLIRQAEALNPVRDESLGYAVYDAVVVYTFVST